MIVLLYPWFRGAVLYPMIVEESVVVLIPSDEASEAAELPPVMEYEPPEEEPVRDMWYARGHEGTLKTVPC